VPFFYHNIKWNLWYKIKKSSNLEIIVLALNTEEVNVFSVTELSQAIKYAVEGNFAYVRVRGEISGFKLHTSGHAYFAIKDKDSVLDAVMWRGTKTSAPIQDGLEVVASGKITTYGARSKYQMVVSGIEPAGQGALLKLLQEKKLQFQKEGLFDRKRPLPKFPKTIGVITSATGAVIRDILHRIEDRFPCHVLLWPVLVQGNGSAEQIASAIKRFNNASLKPDVLIVARGGGSLEDLWSFNEEIVVRAAATSDIPIISAVGHETDFTLVDFAADVRAPTPTAAAEMATPDRQHLNILLKDIDAKINRSFKQLVEFYSLTLNAIANRIPDLPLIIFEKAQKLDDWTERLIQAVKNLFAYKHKALSSERLPSLQQQIMVAENNLESGFKTFKNAALNYFNKQEQELQWHGMVLTQNSYKRTLEKGFCLVSADAGVIRSASEMDQTNNPVELHFHDGQVRVKRL
jgi:exodeoxyribonuclease VII large subunit